VRLVKAYPLVILFFSSVTAVAAAAEL